MKRQDHCGEEIKGTEKDHQAIAGQGTAQASNNPQPAQGTVRARRRVLPTKEKRSTKDYGLQGTTAVHIAIGAQNIEPTSRNRRNAHGTGDGADEYYKVSTNSTQGTEWARRETTISMYRHWDNNERHKSIQYDDELPDE
jgi:hypothetical protein